MLDWQQASQLDCNTIFCEYASNIVLKAGHPLSDWLRNCHLESFLTYYKLVLYNYVCHCVLYIQQSICCDHRVQRYLGLDESEFTKSVSFYFFTLLGHIASVNNVVVTALYLLWALHQRIIVYRIMYKIQRIRASLATANYDNKQSDCLSSRSQRLIGL